MMRKLYTLFSCRYLPITPFEKLPNTGFWKRTFAFKFQAFARILRYEGQSILQFTSQSPFKT